MKRLVIFAGALAMSLSGPAGAVMAQDAGQVETPAQVDLDQKSNEVVTAVDGNAAAMGPGDASASPGTVTRGADVIAPLSDSATTRAISCSSYGSWYDAQVAYEAAGATAADPAMVQALDPDYDGIACEDGM